GFEALVGSSHDDKLTGNALANAIDGGDGDDVVDGAGGDDTLIGNTGTDTASFASSTTAVHADLGTGGASGDGTDTLTAFERLRGSDAGDELTGDGEANLIKGRGG